MACLLRRLLRLMEGSMEGFIIGLDNALGCPICHEVPKVTNVAELVFDGLTLPPSVELRCPEHPGYIASGDDVTMAIIHWNKFIRFIVRDAIQNSLHHWDNPDWSVCPNCRVNTPTTQFNIPPHTIAECGWCNLPKRKFLTCQPVGLEVPS
jgi:hypothetical protein